MKTLFVLGSLLLLSSCVFEAPFESTAKIPVDPGLLGIWEEAQDNDKRAPERLLVLQHSENEYLVEYPVGKEAMYFRAFTVELSGAKYIQIQLLGTAKGPEKAEDRKFHLLKSSLERDALGIQTINPDIIGKNHADSAQMKAAFNEHKDDPKLFGEAQKFHRMK